MKVVSSKEEQVLEIYDGNLSNIPLFEDQPMFLKLSLKDKEAPLTFLTQFKNNDDIIIESHESAELFWSFSNKEPSRNENDGSL